MNQINNDFNESAYTFTTKEGLNVILIHKKGFNRSVAALGTPFGSIHEKQKYDGKIVEHKHGLAHFLEHKLFDDAGEDILSKFSKYGANANAFTSFDQTVYYFSTNLSLYEPLSLLIDFVNRFDITEASVEKEKGIIVEELKMYEKMADMKLLMNTYENVYHKFPLKYDIGGTEASVNATTLQDLELAYALNYNPYKMGLVIISGDDPEKIKAHIEKHSITNEIIQVEDIFDEEPLSVVKENNEIVFPVKLDKMSLSFKFKYNGNSPMFDAFKIKLILALNFTEFNESYQTWLDEEIINDYFSYDVDLRDGFGVIYFFNEGQKHEEFKNVIKSTIELLKVDEICYNQIKKRYYGQTILSLSQYDRYAINLLTSYFKNTDYYEYLKNIRDVSLEEILETREILKDFNISFNRMING